MADTHRKNIQPPTETAVHQFSYSYQATDKPVKKINAVPMHANDMSLLRRDLVKTLVFVVLIVAAEIFIANIAR